MVLVGGVGVIALVAFMRRKRSLPTGGLQGGPQGGYAGPGAVQGAGLGGAQTFGAGNAPMQPGYGQPAYGQPGFGQPAYGQAPGSGLGGRIAGGLATGLAVGAGVMAAQAIGKNLMGNNEQSARHADGAAAGDNLQPLPGNRDMGGQDFGIQDAGSWDDAGGSIADAGGGGGDWDT